MINHDFVQIIVDLYKELPQSNPEIAARSVAVLLDRLIDELESDGVEVTKEELLKRARQSLQEMRKTA